MPIRPCPCCERPTTRLLKAPSEYAWFNYYRCERCGCVWTTPKDNPDATPHIVAEGVLPD